MFKLILQGSPIATGVRISHPGHTGEVLAHCSYYSLARGSATFAGLELSDRHSRNDSDNVEIDRLYIINMTINAETWVEVHRWVGWTDDNDRILVLWKDITDKAFIISPIGDFVDFALPNGDKTSKSVELNAHVSECQSLHELSTHLSRNGHDCLMRLQ